MTPIAITDAAGKELAAIKDYYAAFGEITANRVMEDILNVFQVLSVFPLSGYEHARGLRRRSSVKFRFIVTYRALPDRVEILSVYRFQNRE